MEPIGLFLVNFSLHKVSNKVYNNKWMWQILVFELLTSWSSPNYKNFLSLKMWNVLRGIWRNPVLTCLTFLSKVWKLFLKSLESFSLNELLKRSELKITNFPLVTDIQKKKMSWVEPTIRTSNFTTKFRFKALSWDMFKRCYSDCLLLFWLF